jgi:hypothetical protein
MITTDGITLLVNDEIRHQCSSNSTTKPKTILVPHSTFVDPKYLDSPARQIIEIKMPASNHYQ